MNADEIANLRACLPGVRSDTTEKPDDFILWFTARGTHITAGMVRRALATLDAAAQAAQARPPHVTTASEWLEAEAKGFLAGVRAGLEAGAEKAEQERLTGEPPAAMAMSEETAIAIVATVTVTARSIARAIRAIDPTTIKEAGHE